MEDHGSKLATRQIVGEPYLKNKQTNKNPSQNKR
jgi:hypothetical protein